VRVVLVQEPRAGKPSRTRASTRSSNAKSSLFPLVEGIEREMVNTARVEPTQGGTVRGLPLATLNHISVLCRCLPSSLTFYTDVLGFVPIHRPGSLNFAGAWYVRSRQQRFKKMQPLQLHSLMTPSFRFCVV
jgi:hypothetical protein